MIFADDYLTGMPEEIQKYGFSKTLLVRKEVIHIKHILTEVFVRKTIDIDSILATIHWSKDKWLEHLINRMRSIHHLSRNYTNNLDDIVKLNRDRLFPFIELIKHEDVSSIIALDFDGTVTSNKFHPLYELCLDRCKTVICTANPTVTDDWFIKKGLSLPHKIYACKGKKAKLNTLIDLANKNDFTFFIDNEIVYLDVAWVMGINTFHYTNGLIKYYSLKTK